MRHCTLHCKWTPRSYSWSTYVRNKNRYGTYWIIVSKPRHRPPQGPVCWSLQQRKRNDIIDRRYRSKVCLEEVGVGVRRWAMITHGPIVDQYFRCLPIPPQMSYIFIFFEYISYVLYTLWRKHLVSEHVFFIENCLCMCKSRNRILFVCLHFRLFDIVSGWYFLCASAVWVTCFMGETWIKLLPSY